MCFDWNNYTTIGVVNGNCKECVLISTANKNHYNCVYIVMYYIYATWAWVRAGLRSDNIHENVNTELLKLAVNLSSNSQLCQPNSGWLCPLASLLSFRVPSGVDLVTSTLLVSRAHRHIHHISPFSFHRLSVELVFTTGVITPSNSTAIDDNLPVSSNIQLNYFNDVNMCKMTTI